MKYGCCNFGKENMDNKNNQTLKKFIKVNRMKSEFLFSLKNSLSGL